MDDTRSLAPGAGRTLFGADAAGLRMLFRSVVFLVLLSIVYAIGTEQVARVARGYRPLAMPLLLAGWCAAAACAFAFRRYRYGEIWAPIRVLLQGTGLVFGVQGLFDAFHPSTFVSHLFVGTSTDARVLIGLMLVAGAFATRRPAFLLPMFLAYFMFRNRVPTAYGFPGTALDFTTPLDVGQFTILALLAARGYDALHRSPVRRVMRGIRLPSDPQHSLGFKKVLWGLAVGMHLGNYFYSAVAKIKLGGDDPLFWVFNNPTERAIAIGLHRFNNPLAQWPWLLDLLYGVMQTYAVAFNVFVLAIQAMSPLSAVNRRALILFTLAFDAMHLGIYGTLGAFFFLWIALNIIILISLSRMTDQDYTKDVKITAVVTAVLGYLSFSTAELGWLDGRKVVREVFHARTIGGELVPVPPAVFGLYTYQISHGDLYAPEGHFKVRFGGNVHDRGEWEDADGCGPATVPEQKYVRSFEGIARLVRDADRHLRAYPEVKRLALFYAYPHHAPTNPTAFAAFNRLRMSEVVGYLYTVESACLYVRNGMLAEQVQKRSEVPIDVAR